MQRIRDLIRRSGWKFDVSEGLVMGALVTTLTYLADGGRPGWLSHFAWAGPSFVALAVFFNRKARRQSAAG